ncbi:Bug family tripartite tricarboxylate transporter substrate binding protein [Aliamphritea spongicola]|uniref:Bug family tripartite tricarboxylate transporter substrate binding protein n=1 Tax=Aliamphritea spongicola TaxID=707589 RepID=UPI00196AE8B9|nr:tripartite tricarboxylate transporter substrate binding protein [Aliamphritea spongicola]MBN3561044.1 tripartite tricarboxylate transporter substrate binding protein [Aliamphritea spongicola]
MKTIGKRLLTTLGISMALVTGSVTAVAADFPTKPVNIIVPYKAGGATDVMARIIAKAMQKQLGKPVVVQNRKGGGGAVAASYVKNRPADGYSVLVGASEISTWIPLTKEVDYKFEDFRHIAAVTEFQNALIANADAPFKTLEEMVEYARQNPGLKIAHQGAISELMLKQLAEKENLDLRMITASGGAEIVQLLLAGQIDVGYSGGIHSSYPGKFEVISSLNKERLNDSPTKKSFAESGYNLAIPAHVVFMVKAGVDDATVKILEEAILEAATEEDFRKIVEDRMKAPLQLINAADITTIIDESQASLKLVASKK